MVEFALLEDAPSPKNFVDVDMVDKLVSSAADGD